MNPARAERGGAGGPAPLVLGLGNLLLRDDAVGLELLARIERDGPAARPGRAVDFVDGGTQGLALLGVMSGRPALLVLDAVRLGAPPGTVHELDADAALALQRERPDTAHAGGAAGLLAIARLAGDLPARTLVVGVEPEIVETGLGLSPRVEAALPAALAHALDALARLCAGLPCTS